jgi:PTH1 family peptidyl-tRNA hydrolase
VLSNFAKDEQQGVEDLCRALAENAPLLIDKADADYQSRVNAAMD